MVLGKYFVYKGKIWHEDDFTDHICELAEKEGIDQGKAYWREEKKCRDLTNEEYKILNEYLIMLKAKFDSHMREKRKGKLI